MTSFHSFVPVGTFEPEVHDQLVDLATQAVQLLTSAQPNGSPAPFQTIGQSILSQLTPEQRTAAIGAGMKMLYGSSAHGQDHARTH